MKLDMKQAYSSYDFDSGAYVASNFAQFSPAYVATNEEVREALRVLAPKPGARVLTVAGSGDQALLYKLAGAAHVDTFDITFNAKMMLDIKTSAIQKLSHIDYLSLLNKIRTSRDIYNISLYQQLVDYMPDDTKNYVREMRGAKLVRGGMLDTVLFKSEYTRLSEIIHGSFNFMWTDLSDLASHLTQSYDQIYLSNILQYNVQPDYVCRVIGDLQKYLNPNGKILVNIAPWFDGDELFAMNKLREKMAEDNLAHVTVMKNAIHSMCVLEKR